MTPNTRSFEHFTYLSQCNQALCIKSETERYRRLRGNPRVGTMGALYWQLNDIWQAPTWAGLEFGSNAGVGAQRWKLLHYYARRFYLPQLISADHMRATGDVRVIVNNDWVAPSNGTWAVAFVSWQTQAPLKQWSGSWSFGDTAQQVLTFNLQTENLNVTTGFLWMQVTYNGAAFNNELLLTSLSSAVTRTLPNAVVSVSNVAVTAPNVATLTVTASALAVFFYIECPSIDGIFSDNGQILWAGQTQITFTATAPFTATPTAKMFRYYSLADWQ